MLLSSSLLSSAPATGDEFKFQSNLLEWVLLSGVPPQVENERLHGVLCLVMSCHTRDLFTRTEIYTLEEKTHIVKQFSNISSCSSFNQAKTTELLKLLLK